MCVVGVVFFLYKSKGSLCSSTATSVATGCGFNQTTLYCVDCILYRPLTSWPTCLVVVWCVCVCVRVSNILHVVVSHWAKWRKGSTSQDGVGVVTGLRWMGPPHHPIVLCLRYFGGHCKVAMARVKEGTQRVFIGAGVCLTPCASHCPTRGCLSDPRADGKKSKRH